MPRGPRLDAPATLHHVMVRGIEYRACCRDARDRAGFVRRVAARATARDWTVYAWALPPNHGHLLVRSGARPLAGAMRAFPRGCERELQIPRFWPLNIPHPLCGSGVTGA